MKHINENTKVTLTLGQLKRLVKEAKYDSRFNSHQILDGGEEVSKFLATIRESADKMEEVAQMEKDFAKITADAVKLSLQAKQDSAAARAAEKQFSKPLDEAAKRMATTMGIHQDIFFSVQEDARKIGVLLTRKRKVISQDEANKAIIDRLMDPDFIKQNKRIQSLSDAMVQILENAKTTLKDMGLFDPGAEQETWSANLFSKDSDGKMTRMNEGFFDGIKMALRKAGMWISKIFMPKYESREERFTETAQQLRDDLSSIRTELEAM